MYAFSNSRHDYHKIIITIYFTEAVGCPVHVDEKMELRFIIFTTLSSAANIFLIVSIIVIAVCSVVKRRKSQRDPTAENERIEPTAVYEEINLHPSSSTSIDTKENVAYRLTSFHN